MSEDNSVLLNYWLQLLTLSTSSKFRYRQCDRKESIEKAGLAASKSTKDFYRIAANSDSRDLGFTAIGIRD
ncbi:MAG TPA: hypothetical protein DEV81_16585 [Cyanobacteria bacterium UBA11049]|nr:hypothetical protein [Cyanobacteria bacterium UBA11049]